MPLGRLGQLLGGRFVARDVKQIFAYRAGKILELLRPGGNARLDVSS